MIDWKALREKYFKECTEPMEVNNSGMIPGLSDTIKKHSLCPHDLFEWFKKEIINAENEGDYNIKFYNYEHNQRRT